MGPGKPPQFFDEVVESQSGKPQISFNRLRPIWKT
jgi:hypothetical protein